MSDTNTTEAAPSADAAQSPHPRHVPLPESRFGVWPWACVRAAGFPAEGILALGAPEVAAIIEEALDAGGDRPLSSFDPARRDALTAAHKAATARVGAHARATARDPRFREAVLWQNRRAVHTGLDALTRKPIEERNKKVRQKECLVASYLQRYCAKNDTIGFFGPVCWARVTGGPEPLEVRVGEGLLARRAVYFEHWCIDAIADRLTQDPELRAWAPPRIHPYVRVEGDAIYLPTVGAVPMSPGQIAVLAACDGMTPARAIATDIAARAELGMAEDDVLRFLDQAHSMSLLGWDFSVALELHPERDLRERLARIGDPALRARALVPLDAIEDARDRVAAAAGDDAALDGALDAFEATFHRITGLAPTRAEGQVYAARTLLYEDAHRAADVAIGAPLLAKLGPPLSLLLASARWLTCEVAGRFRRRFDALHDRLAPAGGGPIDLASFHRAFLESEPSIANRGSTLPPDVLELQEELQARWGQILRLSPDERRARFESSRLRPRVLDTFAAERPGWEQARYVSPDVMILAESLDGIRRNDFQLVLGEVHLANTLIGSLFAAQHPDPADLQQVIDLDLGAPQIVPLRPKQSSSQRTNPAFLASGDLRYAYSQDPSPAPPTRTLRVADLVLVRRDGVLEVRHRSGVFHRTLLEFMGTLLTLMCGNALQILPDRAHLPRVTIDEVVIARESWSFEADELAFASIADPLARSVELKRWQRRHGVPRFVFVKAPIERKPYFVDLDGPLSIETFSKLIRQTGEAGAGVRIRVSEMLPSFEHAIFPDAEGRRYTSELRLVMVDSARPAPLREGHG